MGRKRIVALGLAALLAVAGCGDEDPTEVGSVIIGEGVRTFEVVLEAESFLVSDTTYDQIGRLVEAPFRMVAAAFGDELDAHVLFRFNLPSTVTYTDTGGVSVTDSTPVFDGARFTLVIDSLSSSARPVELAVLPVTESWDDNSVSWSLRSDTGGVAEPWTQPGGTTGPLVGTAQWGAGDTVVIAVDSASAAVWTDSLAERSALVRTASPGSRVFIRSIAVEFEVITEEPTDTAITAGTLGASRIIATPEAPPAAETVLRVGGLPTWRSLLQFEPLAGLSIDCSVAVGAPCTVPLNAVNLSLATLVLVPEASGPFRVERPIRIEGRAVLEAPGVPLIRSPLSGNMGRMQDSMTVDLFTAPPPGSMVEVPITSFVNRLISPPADAEPWQWLALTAVGERATFGYTSFLSSESATPPRLRLVVTAPETALQR